MAQHKNITNQILLQFDEDCQRMMQGIQGVWNASKINEFYNKNQIRIMRLRERLHDVEVKYIHFDPEDETKMLFSLADPSMPQFREGMTHEGFMAETKPILDEIISFEV